MFHMHLLVISTTQQEKNETINVIWNKNGVMDYSKVHIDSPPPNICKND
jgi:hypothetical protein